MDTGQEVSAIGEVPPPPQDIPLPFTDAELMNPMEGDVDGQDIVSQFPFANEENKFLSYELKRKDKRLAELSAVVKENEERVQIMQEHLKNVDQELIHTQALVDAKTREIETEKHLRILADKERHRLLSDIKNTQNSIDDHQNRLNQIHNQIFNANEKMDQFKLKMNWNQEELEQWALAAKQKEEDNLALERYRRADDAKIVNMNVHIEKVSAQREESIVELEKEITETKAAQIELDNAAEEFRKLHLERSSVIGKWDEAMRAIHRRNQSIAKLGDRLNESKRKVEEKVAEMNKFREIRTQAETEWKNSQRALGAVERELQAERKKHSQQHETVNTMENNMMLLKSEILKAQSDLKRAKQENETMEKFAAQKQDDLSRHEKALREMKERRKQVKEQVTTLKNKADHADELFEKSKKQLEELNKEQRNLKTALFKETQNLFKLRKEETNMMVMITGTQASARNLQSKIDELGALAMKQETMLYNINFQIQQLESKVERAQGKRSQEETVELKKRIKELQVEKEEGQRNLTRLREQVKSVIANVAREKRKRDAKQAERNLLDDKIAETELQNESIMGEIASLDKEALESIVGHDEQKLQASRLTSKLNDLVSKVFALEKEKYELQLRMEERNREIDEWVKRTQAKMRVKQQQRHDSILELKQCEARVEKLKAKYKTLTGKIRPSGDDDENKSQAYYIVKVAQEREELQQRGDALNEDIKKSEKEIFLLQKTLQHLTVKNQEFRDSFHQADMGGPESRIKARLEEQFKAISDSLYTKKSYLKDIQMEYDEKVGLHQELRQSIEICKDEIARREEEIQELDTILESQLNSANYSWQIAQTAKQGYRAKKAKNADDPDLVMEAKIEAHSIRRKVDLAKQLLDQVGQRNMQQKQAVN